MTLQTKEPLTRTEREKDLSTFSLSKKESSYYICKRTFDILFSILILFILSPVFALIWIGIRCSSSGKVIYSQERIGLEGKTFNCYKFRTMYLGADSSLKEILLKNPSLKEEWERNQKLRHDPRIFPLGKWLRKTSLDELPQFFNVIKGDLSIVGPRPYMVCQRKELGPSAYKILSVRPGITGLWQTSGRSRTTFQERIALDAEYIDRQTLGFDLLLILKTIPLVLFTRDAC